MFDKEICDGRGQHCQRFPDGCSPESLRLVDGERVYGVYKDKYYFTPKALHVADRNSTERIPWEEIRSCTTRHGDGKKKATLTLIDGTTREIRVSDLATGWSGRVSQLFHQMIEKLGSQLVVGLALKSLDDFFAKVDDKYSLFPNLDPHPSLDELRGSLNEMLERDSVSDVRILLADDDPNIGIGLAIQTSMDDSSISEWALSLGADGVIDAEDSVLQQFHGVRADERVVQVVWD
jgi:hypothetical protein